MELTDEKIGQMAQKAVQHFWLARDLQATRQKTSGKTDQGYRGAVTGGAQMNGFVDALKELACLAGISPGDVYSKHSLLELPGYFRPTKEWDILIVQKGVLLAAIEAKSQVGPSFGNNFNNRTEEAMGSALDLWTAFREKAFGGAVRPWLGYIFLLEDCLRSQRPVGVKEPHFRVFPEFRLASYAKRYALFCGKLVLERHYDAAALLTSTREEGTKGVFTEPCPEIGFKRFVRSLFAHLQGSKQ